MSTDDDENEKRVADPGAPEWRPTVSDIVAIEYGSQRADGIVVDVKAHGQWASVRPDPRINIDGLVRHTLVLVRDDTVPNLWIELNTTAKIIMRLK